MESALEHILMHRHKAEMQAYVAANPDSFDELIQLALIEKHPYSWRASWLLWSVMSKNDKRFEGYLDELVDILPHRKDNQKREFLMILQRLDLKEEHEGRLIDICISLWESTEKQPSVRANAFKLLLKISKKYPELKQEIKGLTEPHYLDSLSKGVRSSVLKMMRSFQQKQPNKIR